MLGDREQLPVVQAAHREGPLPIALEPQPELEETQRTEDARRAAGLRQLDLGRRFGLGRRGDLQAELFGGEQGIEVRAPDERGEEHASLMLGFRAVRLREHRTAEPVHPGRVGARLVAHPLDHRAYRRPVACPERGPGHPAQGLVGRPGRTGLAGPGMRLGQQPAHAPRRDLRPHESAVGGAQPRPGVRHLLGGRGRIAAGERRERDHRELA
jgi:hypothetical protein